MAASGAFAAAYVHQGALPYPVAATRLTDLQLPRIRPENLLCSPESIIHAPVATARAEPPQGSRVDSAEKPRAVEIASPKVMTRFPRYRKAQIVGSQRLVLTMAAKPKFSDSAIAQKVDFRSAVAAVDDELKERLERAKRETESQLRNFAGMLIFQFEESGDNEWIIAKLPDFMADLKVEHGKAKGNAVTLKSLYSAVNAHIKSQNGNNPVKAVWSEKAQVLAVVRTDRDGEFEPTLKPRTRKTKAEAEVAKAEGADGSDEPTADADATDASDDAAGDDAADE